MALADSTGAPAPASRKPRGRHPLQRFTALEVRNLRTPGRHADGNGLYLEIDVTGAKRWLLRTVVHGRRQEIGLGSALLVPLVDVRETAVRLRRIARAGGEPRLVLRQERETVPTFRDAALQLHADRSKGFRNPKHAAQWLTSLETAVFPVFGSLRVDRVESREVLAALTPIWRKTPETARRVQQRIKAVLDWAKASGYRKGDNPVDGVRLVLEKVSRPVKHHAALPHPQVASFIAALRGAEASELARLAFEFLVLTATRTIEVRLARPEEIDRQARVWTIPAARMKAHREHQVPLSARCLEILERAELLASDSPYVFPGRRLEKPLSEMTFLMLLRRLGRRDVTVHGFRSTFRDWAGERHFPRDVAEAALAHTVKDKVEAAYLRTKFFEQRRELMETWALFATGRSGTVVSIRA